MADLTRESLERVLGPLDEAAAAVRSKVEIIPVRIERSRDAPQPCAAPTGVSTSLDTSGRWEAGLVGQRQNMMSLFKVRRVDHLAVDLEHADPGIGRERVDDRLGARHFFG